MIRQQSTLADFAPRAGARCYFRLRAKHLVLKPRLPSSAGSIGIRFIRLCDAVDPMSTKRKTLRRAFFYICWITRRYDRLVLLRENSAHS